MRTMILAAALTLSACGAETMPPASPSEAMAFIDATRALADANREYSAASTTVADALRTGGVNPSAGPDIERINAEALDWYKRAGAASDAASRMAAVAQIKRLAAELRTFLAR